MGQTQSRATKQEFLTPYFDQLGKDAKETDSMYFQKEMGVRNVLSKETVIETMLIGEHGPRVAIVHDNTSHGTHMDAQLTRVEEGKEDSVSSVSFNVSHPTPLFNVDVGGNNFGYYGGLKRAAASYAIQARRFTTFADNSNPLVRDHSILSGVVTPFFIGETSPIALSTGVQMKLNGHVPFHPEDHEVSGCMQLSSNTFALTTLLDHQHTSLSMWKMRKATGTQVSSIFTFPHSNLGLSKYSFAIEHPLSEQLAVKARVSSRSVGGSILASTKAPVPCQLALSAEWRIQDPERTMVPHKLGVGLLFGSV